MVDATFIEISDALAKGEPVKLAGFGNFQLRDKGSRPGHNPRTDAAATISPQSGLRESAHQSPISQGQLTFPPYQTRVYR